MTQLLQTSLDGFTVGSLYALIALGYTMVYGILKFINFAHGDVFALGVHLTIAIAAGLGVRGLTADGPPPFHVGLVVLEIGRLAAVENEALAFCFEAVCKGSVAEGATLEIVEVPGEGWCVTCAQSIPMEQLYGDCPLCGGLQTQVTGGTGMRVLEIGIE